MHTCTASLGSYMHCNNHNNNIYDPHFPFPSANLRCYFVGDEPLGDPNITKVLPTDEETTMLSWEHTQIVEIHKRRYMLKDNALEIFLINGRTLLLAFTSTVVNQFCFSFFSLSIDIPISFSLPPPSSRDSYIFIFSLLILSSQIYVCHCTL